MLIANQTAAQRRLDEILRIGTILRDGNGTYFYLGCKVRNKALNDIGVGVVIADRAFSSDYKRDRVSEFERKVEHSSEN